MINLLVNRSKLKIVIEIIFLDNVSSALISCRLVELAMNVNMSNSKTHILVGCTGSVATIKLPELVREILQVSPGDIEVRVIVTNHASHFFNKTDIPNVEIYNDEEEWSSWKKRGDPVLHIELGKWAHTMIIAPLDANTLAKIAQGLCDNLLTCVVRAWDLKKPLIFCPAMNTRMWEHPITLEHISTLKSWGYKEIPCISKTLVCGDSGMGAMAEVSSIVCEIQNYIR